MVRIRITRDAECIRRVRSTGHAIAQKGTDSAACASVSAVLKAFGLTIVESESCDVRGGAPRPGLFDLECIGCRDREWFRGVGDLFVRSVTAIRDEWPNQVEVEIDEE